MNIDPQDYEITITHVPGAEPYFIARAVEWPKISAHSETREEAVREIQVALELAIEVFTEQGRPIPQPRLALA